VVSQRGSIESKLLEGIQPPIVSDDMKRRKSKSSSNIFKRQIRQFILSNFLPGDGQERLRNDDLLFEGAIIDSGGALTLICFLEETYGFKVLDEELFPENFASVNHIVAYVSKKKKIIFSRTKLALQ
jgi:acyl carrier protein